MGDKDDGRGDVTPLRPGEFYNEGLGCRFTVPEPLRLRDVERYEAARNEARTAEAQSAFSINWVGAVALIEEWECEALPDLQGLSPEDVGDAFGAIMQVIVWAGGQVSAHVMTKLFIPKN